MPRNPVKPGYFSSFGMSADHDAALTEWMNERLTISSWATPRVGALAAMIEDHVLQRLLPRFNFQKVTTPWAGDVAAARAVMAREAKEWKGS